jgi:Flp pilus assembly protein TadG
MRALTWLKDLLSSERGNVLVIAAATMPLLIGSAALAIDTIQMDLWKRQMQRAADSGALAGAFAIAQSKQASPAVTRDLLLNNDVTLSGTPVVENAPTVGAYAGNVRAVRVVLSSQRTMPFMSFFTRSSSSVTVEATATAIYQGQYCMVSLESGNVTGITFSGSTSVDLGCGVVSNSRAASAVVAGGSATIRANPVSAVGGVPSSTAYVQPTTLMPYVSAQADPYALLPRTPSPPAGLTCQNKLRVQPNDPPPTITGGVNGEYCFKGMDIKGTVNLPPGTYYIDGSSFDLGAQAVVNGTGVTIILTSSTPGDTTTFAGIDMNGGAVINLTSPTSGTYKGVLFYGDPRTPYANTTINGNSASLIEGGLYFPSRQLTFNGNTGLQTRCIQLVARRLVFSGNSSVQNDCPATGGAKAFDATFVRLVA